MTGPTCRDYYGLVTKMAAGVPDFRPVVETAGDTVPIPADVPISGRGFEYDFSMRLQYNYRLYPAPGQRVALARGFGCARVVFNDALAAREAACQAGGALPH